MNVPGYESAYTVAKRAVRTIHNFRDGNIRPLISSIKTENNVLGGFLPGEQWIIAAASGGGKTAYAIHKAKDFANPILNPAYAGKILILIDTLEMQSDRLIIRDFARETNTVTHDILSYQKRLSDEKLALIEAVAEQFMGVPIYYSQISVNADNWEKRKAEVQALNPDYYIVNIVDHLRLITKKNEDNEREIIDNISKAGMRVKKDFGMLNIFLSQLNRNIETGTDRKNIGEALPIKSDLFGSDFPYQSADGVIALHRPGAYELKEWRKIPTGLTKQMAGDDHLLVANVLKQREGVIGPYLIRHNLKHYQFSDMDSIGDAKKGGRVKYEIEDL